MSNMRFNLRTKLFLSLIFVSSSLIVALFFMLQWSFDKGAKSFIEQQDQQQLSMLATELANYHMDLGGWNNFAQSQANWQKWLQQHTLQALNLPPAPNHAGQPPEPMGNGMRPPAKPFYLLDAQGQTIAGRAVEQGKRIAIFSPTDSNKLLGFIGIPPQPNELFIDFKRSALSQSQMQLVWYLLLGAIFLSIIVAFPASALLSKRIKNIHTFVDLLAKGDYKSNLAIAGSDEISQLADNLNSLALRLDQAQQQRQQMTADVSHELRTPVATLQANIEAMQDGIVPLDQTNVTRIHNQILRLSKLIDDLYQLSLADIGALSYRFNYVELNQVLEDFAHEYQSAFSNKGLCFNLQINTSTELTVSADYFRLKQAIANLLENSLKYTDAPGQVIISLDVTEDTAVIQLNDSPPSVPEEYLSRLTERLFRVDKSRNRNIAGSGLGLNLVMSIINAHKGTLNFSHSQFGGLSATITLPLVNYDD
ncbi:ATP-binding protein [Catenovulum sp. SX2]|uniref:ATP-binding protein n=1 Tax=Catenovulum sp. SX2 TaxID=3398614 RepID=UPI003F8619FA